MFTILVTILTLGVLIFVHELGHFLVAKLSGICVERFSIGYPPTIVRKKLGETEYCIGAVPFGGYVKLKGENPEEGATSPDSFRAKHPATRIAVLFAGPFMNVLLGFLLLWAVLVGYGESTPQYDKPKIGSVMVGMPAHKAGLKPGDIILKVEQDTVRTWEDLANLVHAHPEETLRLVVMREDSVFSVLCKTFAKKVKFEGKDTVFGMIGIVPSGVQRKVSVGEGFLLAIRGTINISLAVIDFVVKLLTGGASLSEIGGPVMIAQVAGETARHSIWQLLMFIAALSVNLALLNLLPLPILDGGQILLNLIEWVRKKEVSLRVQAVFQQISIFLLLLLMLLVTIKDIFNLF